MLSFKNGDDDTTRNYYMPLVEIKKFKTFIWKSIWKVSFSHDATYFDSKDLVMRTISDKILKDRAY